MLTVAYLANIYPSPVEPYVGDQIKELRARGVRVIAGTVKRTRASNSGADYDRDALAVRPVSGVILVAALWLLLRRGHKIFDLLIRIAFRGQESPLQRIKALIHTTLGVCYAAQLEGLDVDHIHVHHGYFGSWIGMVAARLLDAGYSLTLHGSDLLLSGSYLDTKLKACDFGLTISEYNRHYIIQKYPAVDPKKILVARLGVALPEGNAACMKRALPVLHASDAITLVAVGRLHRVKNHAFLIRACAQLRANGITVECLIAGEGGERHRLEKLIHKLDLQESITLLGHVPHEQLDSLYGRADLVVLTSQSEGLPLVLMEAMARGRLTLAPRITGIPELITHGKCGFLYTRGSEGDFVAQILAIRSLLIATSRGQFNRSTFDPLDRVRYGAFVRVLNNYNQHSNLEFFADLFLQRISLRSGSLLHEDFVLQQI